MADSLDLIKPGYYMWVFYCIFPYTVEVLKDEVKILKFSRALVVFNICLITTLTVLEGRDVFSKIHSVYDLIGDVSCVMKTLFMAYYLLIVYSSNLLYRDLIRYVNEIKMIDDKFREMDVIVDNQYARKMLKTALVVDMVFTIISLSLNFDEYLFSISFLVFIVRALLANVRNAVVCEFLAFVLMIYERFRLLNMQLSAYKCLYEDASPIIKRKLNDSIKLCFNLHSELCRASQTLMKSFELKLTTTILSTMWYIITALYFLIIHTPLLNDSFTNKYFNGLKIISHGAAMMIVSLVCTTTQREACRTSELMAHLLEETDGNWMYTRCVLMMGRKLKFTAMGFFPIDMPMFGSMFVSITTYLFILGQITPAK